jgi:hypothetical protein
VYHSRFNHVRAYFRASQQFVNQVPIIDGKRQGKDVNLYKLFLEQGAHLLRAGSHCGIVIPSGIYTDLGAMRLREMLLSQTRITGLFGFENRREIFENVHRSFKFIVLTFQPGAQTDSFPARFMRLDTKELADFPSADAISMSVELIRKLSPETLSFMEFRSETDVKISERLFRFPPLGRKIEEKWNFKIHREFNLTDDISLFHEQAGEGRLQLLTGKMFHQFRLTGETSGYWIEEQKGRIALAGATVAANTRLDYQNYRWVYRRIARNTDSRTMISTIASKMVFTEVNSPTLDLPASGISMLEQLFLCAIANSFALDWYLRLKITTTLNFFYIYQLPLPRLTERDLAFRPLVERAARLIGATAEFDDLLKEVFGPQATHQTHGVIDEGERLTLRAEIDALVAQLYDLTEDEFAHILATFPLVPASVKMLTLDTFRALLPSPDDVAVARLIAAGESEKVEFKEAIAYNRQNQRKQPEMVNKALREVAAFLNTAGGSVLIGVDDAGQVTGIADDLLHADQGKPNRDGYELFLRNQLSSRLGTVPTAPCGITFHQVSGREVCRILVLASPKPVYLDGELIVRAGSSSRTLKTQEATAYIFQHWNSLV